MNGQFVDWDDATVHPEPTLHYGWACSRGSGIRHQSGPAVFRLTDHINAVPVVEDHLMEPDFTAEQVIAATKETVRINEVQSANPSFSIWTSLIRTVSLVAAITCSAVKSGSIR